MFREGMICCTVLIEDTLYYVGFTEDLTLCCTMLIEGTLYYVGFTEDLKLCCTVLIDTLYCVGFTEDLTLCCTVDRRHIVLCYKFTVLIDVLTEDMMLYCNVLIE